MHYLAEAFRAFDLDFHFLLAFFTGIKQSIGNIMHVYAGTAYRT